MLLQLYPRVHRRYSSLPVFGPVVENFGAWLLKEGYSTDCIREHFCCMRRIVCLLHKRGVGSMAELTRAKLQACAPAQRLDDRRLAASVRLLERYFASETSLFGTQLVIGVALFLAYELRALGPAGKIVTGYLTSVIMLTAGIVFERRERYRLLARAAVGGGWALLFFTTYAAKLYSIPIGRRVRRKRQRASFNSPYRKCLPHPQTKSRLFRKGTCDRVPTVLNSCRDIWSKA